MVFPLFLNLWTETRNHQIKSINLTTQSSKALHYTSQTEEQMKGQQHGQWSGGAIHQRSIPNEAKYIPSNKQKQISMVLLVQ